MAFLPAPDRPLLATGEAHVWRVELEGPHRSAFDQTLRLVLGRYLDEEAGEIELIAGEHGKPRLADQRLHFNLSHSGAVGLVAVCADREVGVDVERIEPGRDFVALAERAFGGDEAAAVRNASEAVRGAVFYERWARHEARLKCLGAGLAGKDAQVSAPITIEPLEVGPGYAAALAAAGSAPLPLRCWTFAPPLPDGEWRVS